MPEMPGCEMSYAEEYRVELPGGPVIKGRLTTIEAAIAWAESQEIDRYMIWAMGAKMYVHRSF